MRNRVLGSWCQGLVAWYKLQAASHKLQVICLQQKACSLKRFNDYTPASGVGLVRRNCLQN